MLSFNPGLKKEGWGKKKMGGGGGGGKEKRREKKSTMNPSPPSLTWDLSTCGQWKFHSKNKNKNQNKIPKKLEIRLENFLKLMVKGYF